MIAIVQLWSFHRVLLMFQDIDQELGLTYNTLSFFSLKIMEYYLLETT